jgi:hypothetical protein
MPLPLRLIKMRGLPQWLIHELSEIVEQSCMESIHLSHANPKGTFDGSYANAVDLLGRVATPKAAKFLWEEFTRSPIKIDDSRNFKIAGDRSSVFSYLSIAPVESMVTQAIVVNGDDEILDALAHRLLNSKGIERGVILG